MNQLEQAARIVQYENQKDYPGNAKTTGELHRCIYDKYSLKKLLSLVGFKNIVMLNAWTSNIYEWEKFYLDADQNGKPYNNDSLYIEGIK